MLKRRPSIPLVIEFINKPAVNAGKVSQLGIFLYKRSVITDNAKNKMNKNPN